MSRLPPDPGDTRRRRYIEAVLLRMERAPEEEARIREGARRLLAMKRARGLAGEAFLERWDGLLDLSLPELRARLLAADAEGRELRHSHLFSGALPVREANALGPSPAPHEISGP